MVQVDGYDAGLAAELEKLWRDTMLKGAKRGIEDAITQQLEPIRCLIEATRSAQASQFKDLDARIKQLEGIDQRLSSLLRQIDFGTQQFIQASTQMLAIPELVGQLEGRTAKLGQLDAHLDALERRANHPDSLKLISNIVDAEGVPDEDRILRLRLLIGQLHSAPLAPPPQADPAPTTPSDQGSTTKSYMKRAWTRLRRWSKPKLIWPLVIVMGLAMLFLLTQSESKIKELFDRQPTPAVVGPTDLGVNDEELIRAGWAVLKAKTPAMAKRVGGDCDAATCDIVELLMSSRANGTTRQLAEAILQLRQPIAGETPPACEFESFDAMLKEARSTAARPQALRACVRNAQLLDGRADRWTASNWNDRLRTYLIAIGSIGELGETIELVPAADLPSAAPAAAGASAASTGSGTARVRQTLAPTANAAQPAAPPPSTPNAASQPAVAPTT